LSSACRCVSSNPASTPGDSTTTSHCLAPIALVYCLAYLLPRRQKIAKAGPLLVIMSWTALVLSAVYCLLMLLFYFIS